MKKKSFLVFLLLVFLLLACAEKKVTIEKPSIKEPVASPGEPWEIEWRKVLGEARREGKVVVSIGGISPEARNALKEQFKKDYDLDLEMVVGRGPELAERILRENRAGLYTSDIYISGITTILLSMKPAKMLLPMESLLILPEVKNPSAWYKGVLPFVDKDKLIFAFSAYSSAGLNINTDHVKAEEVRSLTDVLSPKWKEKIVMEDPTIPGQGWSWFAAYGVHVMGLDYMRELVKQKPFLSRDQRQIVEWLAQGKYPIALGGFPDMIVVFQKAGSPIEMLTPQEGGYLTSGFGNIAVLSNVPHPAAAQVFLNWLLSKKGQIVFNTVVGYQSAREDGPVEHLANFGRKPRQYGEKNFDSTTEEFNARVPKHLEMAREIFGPILR